MGGFIVKSEVSHCSALQIPLADHDKILRPKMNCIVRFGNDYSETSPCLPWQRETGQQGWFTRGTLRKQFTKPTVQFILGRSRIKGQDLPFWKMNGLLGLDFFMVTVTNHIERKSI